MTREEVKTQLEAFFRKMEIKASFFEEKNFAKATVGEAVIGFEFVENESFLKAQALIYRFRNSPNPITIEALFAEQQNADTGGGKLQFNEEDFSLYLEKIFNEKISSEQFYEQLKQLAQASIVWSSEILPQIAQRVHSI